MKIYKEELSALGLDVDQSLGTMHDCPLTLVSHPNSLLGLELSARVDRPAHPILDFLRSTARVDLFSTKFEIERDFF